eukprot:1160937-Pelagomonas_calceolata.AAC.14
MWQLFAAQLSADDGKGHWRPWSSSDHHHKSTAKPTLRVRRERRASELPKLLTGVCCTTFSNDGKYVPRCSQPRSPPILAVPHSEYCLARLANTWDLSCGMPLWNHGNS